MCKIFSLCMKLFRYVWNLTTWIVFEVGYRGQKLENGCKIGKRSGKTNISFFNSHNTFWGQKEIETDICPGETFNDSCTSVDKTMYVCLFGVFYTLGRNYTVYKSKGNDTNVDIKLFFFLFRNSKKAIWKMTPQPR